MQIKRIKATNFKTYLELDVDLSVEEDRPIILIGGLNGGGKTTLFEAIYGALYGLKINSEKDFRELLNSGVTQINEPKIELEMTFTGRVLSQEQTYILKRTYLLNPDNKPVESVKLNMSGTVFLYGTATPTAKRVVLEAQVNKIIKANLPQELSRYFLFDAMEAGHLLKEDQLNRVIKENIENVMGFNKYIQLSKVSKKLLEDYTAQRIQVENEQKEYMGLVGMKKELEQTLVLLNESLETCLQYSTVNKELCESLKSGQKEEFTIKNRIQSQQEQIHLIKKRSNVYHEDLEKFVNDLEMNVFMPRVASSLVNEVALILKMKNEKAQEDKNQLNEIQIREVANQMLLYMNARHLLDQSISVEDIVNYIFVNQMCGSAREDKYDYLDEAEVTALQKMVDSNYNNSFLLLHQSQIELDLSMKDLPALEKSLEIYKQELVGKDYSLLKAYEGNESEIQRLQNEIISKKSEIDKLDKKIHSYDVQIQQEPDLKYDTLAKLQPFFDDVANQLLKMKKIQIEIKMKNYLNLNLAAYKDVIGRVELSESLKDLTFKLFHKSGNEIVLNHLNSGSKQLVIQVLLKVLHELGDYDPPVMIDTVMGVLDKESRETIMENYFPELADQTILLSTDTEIRAESDYIRLAPFISKTYTLLRNRECQCTEIVTGYFGLPLNN